MPCINQAWPEGQRKKVKAFLNPLAHQKPGKYLLMLSYRLEESVACSLLNKVDLERSKGLSILATSKMDPTAFPTHELSKTYKG
ncbi:MULTISPECIES: hypothetical protein [unclassified Neochlamydia]|uniref:hypothetical protein n=1 Tax=unclassified Neochlamydia TaxID=2643326 RepID=UPI00140E3021|nr:MULTISPECIES: hypothetical protein [unclassified Neochlamydia]NGY95449.1 hypothetical protein [Neochlamydia sp. AcF84]